MMSELIFWFAILVGFYTYIVYPCVIFLLSRFINFKTEKDEIEPFVTLIITAYNEEKYISRKIENTLSLDYPQHKLEMIIASDGSTDKTDQIVKEYIDRGVKFIRTEGRVGKTESQNQAVAVAKGEIIIFSDAASMYEKDAIRKIVRNYNDTKVGGVAGKCRYIEPDANGRTAIPTKVYWWCESLLKRCQTQLGTITGASGLIYSVRKEYYVPLPKHIISDMVQPMMIVKQNKRFVYESEAIAYEETTSELRQEFRMRVRVIARGMVGIIYMRSLLNPMKYGWISFQLISHKILRWFTPFYLIALFTANIFLISQTFYLLVFLFQVAFYCFAIASIYIKSKSRISIIQNILLYILSVSGASLIAFIKILIGTVPTIWETER